MMTGGSTFRKFIAATALVAWAGVSQAQIPDVKLHLDALGTYRFESKGPSSFRYYSLFGEPSVASLRFTLETGFTGYISQKLQRIPNDGDPYPFDEAYIEDEGIWRVGKQVLPFGTGHILRESVVAVRGDTTLIAEGVPASFAICDAGDRRQEGFVGRIGPQNYGLSAAVGHHFGINGSSLTQIRLPSQTGGEGRGWNQVYGADARYRVGKFALQGEAVALRGGSTQLDKDLTIFDVSAVVTRTPFDWVQLGYTREANTRNSFYRVRGSLGLTENVSVQPFVRYRNAELWDIGVEVRLRL